MSTSSDRFNELVHEALKNENFKTYKFSISGGNEKGEGYIGDITFVNVSAQKMDGSHVTCNLVLKIGGKNKDMRSITRLGFEREIHIYVKVLPAFRKLQQENNLPPFSAVPRCYLTSLTNHEEVLVLEDIKSKGFRLYNRKIAMNLKHMKLALKTLAEWHALSLALRHKNPEEFEALTSNWTGLASEIFVTSHVGNWLNQAQEHLYDVLRENELPLLEMYKEKVNNQLATSIIANILSSRPNEKVITHGDCWNNNFMFKYEERESEDADPIEVAFLDFQISAVASPVVDLSYFIYAVSSHEELEHFDEILEEYYNHLAQYLLSMQCEPEEIFPFSSLRNHWLQYSAYGALIQPMIVCDALVDNDDAASYSDAQGNYENILECVSRKKNEAFTSRLIAVARHFVGKF